MLKTRPKLAGGFALIEAMVTVVILIFGMLGLVGLQTRMAVAEMESYQRSQALILVNDMAQRISTNPKGASCYAVNNVGIGATAPVCPSTSTLSTEIKAQVNADLAAWHAALQGAAEKTAATGGSNVGAMIGARGCIVALNAPTATDPLQLLVTVAWQGMSETAAAPVSCGSGAYAAPGATASDAARRTLSIAVRTAYLGVI